MATPDNPVEDVLRKPGAEGEITSEMWFLWNSNDPNATRIASMSFDDGYHDSEYLLEMVVGSGPLYQLFQKEAALELIEKISKIS